MICESKHSRAEIRGLVLNGNDDPVTGNNSARVWQLDYHEGRRSQLRDRYLSDLGTEASRPGRSQTLLDSETSVADLTRHFRDCR